MVGFSAEFEHPSPTTMKHALTCLGVLFCAGALALGCGRSELDLGDVETLPAGTGAAGTSPITGAAGNGPITGAAGSIPTTGTAGTRGGTAGTSPMTGAAGSGPMTGAAGTRGTAGSGAMTGAAGRPPMPTPIPCGAATCTPGAQTCCIRVQAGRPSASCIAAGDACDAGTTLGCLDTPSCGPGAICCVSTQTFSTSCSAPQMCGRSGLILCSADADCPGQLPNCCGPGNFKICGAQPCRGGGGGGGRRPPPPPRQQ
jgi:hypothetical protein